MPGPGPANGIMGGDTNVTDMPQTQADDTAFAELQKTARFSKSAEFKELKEYMQKRMDYYKVYMPDGKPIVTVDRDMSEIGYMWIIANGIIGEFQAVIDVYESAAEQVKDEATRRKRA